jgi:putative nucleotidyltransferase with HDIG domain
VGLFASTQDRSRALRTRRIRHLGEDAPVQSRARALLGTLSLGASGVLLAGALLAVALVSIGRLSVLGGAREVGALGVTAALSALVVGLAARAFAPSILERTREAARCAGLACAALALVRASILLGVPFLAPVPLAGAIACIAYGPAFALLFGAPLAFGVGLARALAVADGEVVDLARGLEYGASFGAAYTVAVVLCRRIPGRGALIRAGFAEGAVLAAALFSARGVVEGEKFFTRFPVSGGFDVFWALANGGMFGFVLFELLPLVERVTGALTDIRLKELGDLNRPILKKMNLEAPGTFHHSQVVARLAEAAAEAIGANGLLARVGAYYHDLGKMAKPVYFTENNKESAKKHGVLAPTLSALVIHAHVKDGIELARDLGLPERVVAFIPEHHGTTACEFFYRQAARDAQARGERVDKEVFRYPGPRPRSKETAIVHLADSCEAVTRSLAEPGLARIQNVVREVILDKVLDHQLDDSPLTLGDLRTIEESFVRVLTGIYHGRVKYPERLEASHGEQRLERLAKLRRGESTASARPAPPSPSATPSREASGDVTAAFDVERPSPLAQERPQGYEPPMTW